MLLLIAVFVLNTNDQVAKKDVDAYVSTIGSETNKLIEVFGKLDSCHLEPEQYGYDARISTRYLVVNYIVTKGSRDLFLLMAKCSFPLYRAIAAFGLRRFEDDCSRQALLELQQDPTEILFCVLSEGESILSCPTYSISQLAGQNDFEYFAKPSPNLRFLDLDPPPSWPITIPD